MRLLESSAARPRRALVCSTLIACALAACSNDLTSPSDQPSATETLTVDAATSSAFLALGETLHVVTGADTTSVTAWDVSLNATNVALNTAGGVTAYCLCGNEALTDAAVMTLTADAQLPTFMAGSSAEIPATTSFTADVFTTHKWYRYNLTGNDHQIWPTFNVYLIKRGAAIYKIQITNYYSTTGTPRQITLRSALIRS